MLPRGVDELLRRLLIADAAFAIVYLNFLAATGRCSFWETIPLSIALSACMFMWIVS